MPAARRWIFPLTIAGVAGLAVLMLGFRLGSTGLWTDESIYAQTAREMARSGDWITPKLCGGPYLIKPVLYHWMAAVAFHLAGESELAARLPQAAAAALMLTFMLAVTGGFARNSDSPSTRKGAWLAAAALLTSPGFIMGARVAGMDLLLSAAITLTILCFSRGYSEGGSLRGGWFVASGFFAGLGLLAKGPLGALIPGLVILIFLALRGQVRIAVSRPARKGALVALLTAAVWYLPVSYLHWERFNRVFWMANNVTRLHEPVSDHKGPITFYVPVFLLAFLPWSFPFAVAFARSVKRVVAQRPTRCAPEDLLLLIWFAAPFIFYSAVATKLPGYILPVFPAAALLTAQEWVREREAPRRRRGGAFRIACALGVMALPGVALAVPFLLEYRYALHPLWIWAYPAATFIVAVPAALSALLRSGRLHPALTTAAGMVFVLGLIRFVVAPVEPYESMKSLTLRLVKLGRSGYPVALAGQHLRGTLFYTDCTIPHPRDMKDLPRPGPGLPLFCLVKKKFLPGLEEWARGRGLHLQVLKTTGDLSLAQVSWE
ncbi:MAG TPA: glycosyltransferase family 39 protein [Candidatus Polarisedimenticolia bacterium]|nr:glycosyltransferase family 39 protein [Candidatus Polarisedimenticolia bacterium]